MSDLREQYRKEMNISNFEAVNKPLIEMTGYIEWLENRKCDNKCIHYCRTHPCVFCTRDSKSKDQYEMCE